MPVPFDPEALRYRGAASERCFQIFNELGFRTLVNEYAPTAASVPRNYRVVNTPEGVEELASRLRAKGTFAFRVLPDRPSAMRAGIVGLAFSTSPRDADYVPIGHRALGDTSSLPLSTALAALKPVLEAAGVTKVGHDLKFDAIVLARHGVRLGGLDFDTMIASYLVDATRSNYPLEELALEHTAYKALTEEDVCGKGVKALSLGDIPVEAALDYAGERADLARPAGTHPSRCCSPGMS